MQRLPGVGHPWVVAMSLLKELGAPGINRSPLEKGKPRRRGYSCVGPAEHTNSLEKGDGMSRVCQVTGKGPISGNNVSHAKNRTRRRFLPNLHRHRFWVASENRWVKLRVSAKGMRIIDKKGIDVVLADLRAMGTKV